MKESTVRGKGSAKPRANKFEDSDSSTRRRNKTNGGQESLFFEDADFIFELFFFHVDDSEGHLCLS